MTAASVRTTAAVPSEPPSPCHTQPPAKATNWPVVKRLVPSTNGSGEVGELVERAEAAHRHHRLDPGPALGVLGPVGLEERREVHEVRADGVDLHACADDLVGDVAHEHVRRRREPTSTAARPASGGRRPRS